MSEEIKQDATPVETTVAATPTTDKPAEGEGIKVLEQDNIPVAVDPSVQEEQGDGLLESMLGYLKRYNGYKYVSCSRVEDIPEDSKKLSMLLNMLVTNYMLKGGTDAAAFKKAFADPTIAYIQIHKTCPTLAPDGLYTPNPDVSEGKETPILAGRFVMSTPDKFQPVILLRTNPGKLGDPNTLGIIYGEPYHKVTAEEIATVLKQSKGSEENSAASVSPNPAAQ